MAFSLVLSANIQSTRDDRKDYLLYIQFYGDLMKLFTLLSNINTTMNRHSQKMVDCSKKDLVIS